MVNQSIQFRSVVVIAIVAAAFAAGTFTAQHAGASEPDSASVPSIYKMQPGDELQIQVMDLPALTSTATVRPDGMISSMLLDDVPAAGRSVSEIRKDLTQRYSKLYRNPQVGVFAKSFSNRSVYVTGEVAKPGSVALAGRMTVVQAVIQAGGFLPSSRAEEAVLLRQTDATHRRVMSLELPKLMNGEGSDVALEPSDVIYVPKSDIKVYVGGEVGRPGMIPLERQLTALRAITAAGGLLSSGSAKGAVLMRDHGNHKPDIIHLQLDAIMKGGAEDVLLQPYDILYVPQSGIARVDKFVDMYIRRVLPATVTGGFSYLLGGAGAGGINCFQ